MLERQTIDMFDRAVREIEQLRRQNEVLSAKVEVLNLIARIAPEDRRGMCVTEDVAFLMRVQRDRLEKEMIHRGEKNNEPNRSAAGAVSLSGEQESVNTGGGETREGSVADRGVRRDERSPVDRRKSEYYREGFDTDRG